MSFSPLTLKLLPAEMAVARLPATAPLPAWATTGDLFAIIRTPDELSIVQTSEAVPRHVLSERDWRCLQVVGPLDFGLVGILSSLLEPLAAAGVSVFVFSTYDTDYLMVKTSQLGRTLTTLQAAGMSIQQEKEDDPGV